MKREGGSVPWTTPACKRSRLNLSTGSLGSRMHLVLHFRQKKQLETSIEPTEKNCTDKTVGEKVLKTPEVVEKEERTSHTKEPSTQHSYVQKLFIQKSQKKQLETKVEATEKTVDEKLLETPEILEKEERTSHTKTPSPQHSYGQKLGKSHEKCNERHRLDKCSNTVLNSDIFTNRHHRRVEKSLGTSRQDSRQWLRNTSFSRRNKVNNYRYLSPGYLTPFVKSASGKSVASACRVAKPNPCHKLMYDNSSHLSAPDQGKGSCSESEQKSLLQMNLSCIETAVEDSSNSKWYVSPVSMTRKEGRQLENLEEKRCNQGVKIADAKPSEMTSKEHYDRPGKLSLKEDKEKLQTKADPHDHWYRTKSLESGNNATVLETIKPDLGPSSTKINGIACDNQPQSTKDCIKNEECRKQMCNSQGKREFFQTDIMNGKHGIKAKSPTVTEESQGYLFPTYLWEEDNDSVMHTDVPTETCADELVKLLPRSSIFDSKSSNTKPPSPKEKEVNNCVREGKGGTTLPVQSLVSLESVREPRMSPLTDSKKTKEQQDTEFIKHVEAAFDSLWTTEAVSVDKKLSGERTPEQMQTVGCPEKHKVEKAAKATGQGDITETGTSKNEVSVRESLEGKVGKTPQVSVNRKLSGERTPEQMQTLGCPEKHKAEKAAKATGQGDTTETGTSKNEVSDRKSLEGKVGKTPQVSVDKKLSGERTPEQMQTVPEKHKAEKAAKATGQVDTTETGTSRKEVSVKKSPEKKAGKTPKSIAMDVADVQRLQRGQNHRYNEEDFVEILQNKLVIKKDCDNVKDLNGPIKSADTSDITDDIISPHEPIKEDFGDRSDKPITERNDCSVKEFQPITDKEDSGTQQDSEVKELTDDQLSRCEDVKEKQTNPHVVLIEECIAMGSTLKGMWNEDSCKSEDASFTPEKTKQPMTPFNTPMKFDLEVADLVTLTPDQWLNDNIINGYLELLMKVQPDDVYCFNTFFYTQLCRRGYPGVKRWTRKVEIFQKSLLFAPLHLGNHWCLAEVVVQNKLLRLYDSQGGSNHGCLKRLVSYLCCEAEERGETDFTWGWDGQCREDIPLQETSSDCGVFVCQYARCRVEGRPLTFDQEDIPEFRSHMIQELLQQRLM